MIRLKDFLGEIQYAFLIVKPTFLDLTAEILEKFKEHGWELSRIRTTRLLESQAQELYDIHKDEDFFENLVQYMSSGLSTGILIKKRGSSNNYLEVVAKIKDEIRDQYGLDDMRNVLHSTDNINRLKKEAGIYF